MKSLFTSSVIILLFLCSCTKNDIVYQQEDGTISEIPTLFETKNGRLRFASKDYVSSQIEAIKEKDALDFAQTRASIMTRSGEEDFISLRQFKIDQDLRHLTQEEIKAAESEGLIYDPDDDIIYDSYFASILNKDREVVVGNEIYKYVDKGVLVCSVENERALKNINVSLLPKDEMEYLEERHIENGIRFIYLHQVVDNEEIISNEETRAATGWSQNGSLVLSNGIVIPRDKIRDIEYTRKASDASWVQRTVSSFFGTNVVAENNFDSKHRMKASMFTQEYVIYRAVGMTVRMQKKTLGIWWRKAAQEFRYGYSAIEIKYSFSEGLFGPPGMPDIPPPLDRVPLYIKQKYTFATKYNYLLRLQYPLLYEPITNGNANELYNKALSLVPSALKTAVDAIQPANDVSPHRGIFTAVTFNKMITVHPQHEITAIGEGREEINWDFKWLSGEIVVGLTIGFNGSITPSLKSFSSSISTTILRGDIYAAVKYDNQWRACRIRTQ